MAWQPANFEDAIFAELPLEERSRRRSYFHPMLAAFHSRPPVAQIDEWDRIGIISDVGTLTEGKRLAERVAELFPVIVPSDPRMIHQIRRLSRRGPHVEIRCVACQSFASPTTMIDVRGYPETFEKPVLHRLDRDAVTGPLVTVMDNEATVRDTDILSPTYRQIIGDEVHKQFRFNHSRPAVAGYEAPVDLKKGAGFVCSGCWTRWIRGRYKIGGVTYTRIKHITLLGAPQDVVDAHKRRPGWATPGLTSY